MKTDSESGREERGRSEAVSPPRAAAETQLTILDSLLHDLDDASQASPSGDEACGSQLIQIRLGIASGLFAALRSKHPPTAMHCLRVAMGCSSWAMVMDFNDTQRDEIEVAALLHDVGKIGVPDNVLRKPASLAQDEVALMDQHRLSGLEIMAACCASDEILEIIQYCSAWFDGSRGGFRRRGEDLPLGARMIAIVDAFDSMTTDHLYRTAMSRERAISELFEYAGTQFDPDLVTHFARLYDNDEVRLDQNLARRWLRQLSPERSNILWKRREPAASEAASSERPSDAFQHELLRHMQDGVAFVDENLRILYWNRAAERITGLPSGSVCDRQWAPNLISLQDGDGDHVRPEDCPVLDALRSGSQTARRFGIRGPQGRPSIVDVQTVPVIGPDGRLRGATLLLRDVSSEATLQERVQKLHEKATRDPLTKVANRAEFDRVHGEFVRTHLEQSQPCSLIMCDIDHFKRVNDHFGHQAGDEALIRFAALLKRSCRQGDLVARYGGEEFTLICADCGNASATERAERIRCELERMPLQELCGRSLTASFGVTELQPGDTADTMLRRADRALLQAKRRGRNRVVQLGAGMDDIIPLCPARHRHPLPARRSKACLIDRHLVTTIPLSVAMEKLRGFVADHKSDIVSIDNHRVILRVDAHDGPSRRRHSDRPGSFVIDLALEERPPGERGGVAQARTPRRTMIHVIIRPQQNRDRRRSTADRARRLFQSLTSYLMAYDPPAD